MHQVLKRLKISWNQARDCIHSPAPDYGAKLAFVAEMVAVAQGSPRRMWCSTSMRSRSTSSRR